MTSRSTFRAPDLESEEGAIKVLLKHLERMESNVVWLRHEVVRQERSGRRHEIRGRLKDPSGPRGYGGFLELHSLTPLLPEFDKGHRPQG